MWSTHLLWREFSPQQGFEEFHCHKRRGYARVISKEDQQIDYLKQQDTIPQRIGKLAQKGVYFLHRKPEHLSLSGIDIIAIEFLKLNQEEKEVQEQVIQALKNYVEFPFLNNKKVIEITSGEEKYKQIPLSLNEFRYTVYFQFDCVIQEDDQTIHIVDFKTGQSDYDLRQAFVYILIGQYIYKGKQVIASFYNLLSKKQSDIYSLTQDELLYVKMKLAKIARDHDQQVKQYKSDHKLFERLYPASPGKGCPQCPFISVCEDYAEYFNTEQ
jgi:hypothetical protein